MATKKFNGEGAVMTITPVGGGSATFEGELIDFTFNVNGNEVDFTTMASGEFGDWKPGRQGELTVDVTCSSQFGAPPPKGVECDFKFQVIDEETGVLGDSRTVRGFIREYKDDVANEELATVSFTIRATSMTVTSV